MLCIHPIDILNSGPIPLGANGRAGVRMTEPPSKKERTGGAPWSETVHHVIRAFPTTKLSQCYLGTLSAHDMGTFVTWTDHRVVVSNVCRGG